jgi:hypothetical protein
MVSALTAICAVKVDTIRAHPMKRPVTPSVLPFELQRGSR